MMLCAHLDTVVPKPKQKELVYEELGGFFHAPFGLGADDRAGVYIILDILEAGYRPTVLFTLGEEIGGVGASELIADYPQSPTPLGYIVQLDRQGTTDAVFYNCDNEKFEDMILDYGFDFQNGSFTDISIIAPKWGIAAVNLSVGYYNEHTEEETFFFGVAKRTSKKVQEMLGLQELSPHYWEYIPMKTNKCDVCDMPFSSYMPGHAIIFNEVPLKLCDRCMKMVNGYTY